MADKVHKIHSLPDDSPWDKGVPPTGSPEHPMMVRGLDRVLSIQRPLVLAHIRSIRLRNPQATPAEIVRILERRYLAAVTTGGAAVGATAVVPGIGTGITLALSGVETLGFVESTALFAQSVAEVHGIAIANPDRARALVMTLMLGKEGVDLVGQLAGQVAGRGGNRSSYWGELVTKSLPRAAVGPLVDQLKSMFVKQFAARGGASFVGKALPFGVGAAIGGAGNHILGRRVLTTSHRAFGAPPVDLPLELEPVAGAEKMEMQMLRGARYAGNAIAGAAGTAARGVGWAGRKVGALTTRRSRGGDDDHAEITSEPLGDHELPSGIGDDVTDRTR
ncbi:hypothetical protein SRABI76_00979 [Microbacterium oxydans]|uniref:Di-and tripeptidase n=1 Tax=Microbacterium oxydans TaxID=82380 RepID=A0A0F0LBN6_9MICO|nr:hypothetical protein [Microbacterium oxydans]KJL28971.1 hypothetical protein RS83_02453 [Microbacterium oxydans]CAH0158687.1 hypothetical protein SRABI76_00979 [Microbacterium oxydans]